MGRLKPIPTGHLPLWLLGLTNCSGEFLGADHTETNTEDYP